MSPIEVAAALLGMICVGLVAARRVANYPFGIASVALYAAVFFDAKLYSDALLQLFYIAANAYGWWNWTRNKAEAGEVVVETLAPRARAAWLGGWAAATLIWGALMHRFTDASYPWVDAGIAIASLVAQWLMAQRKLENWWIWIAVDIASMPLYAVKGLRLTMGLYMVYFVLAVWGLVGWRHALRRAEAPAAA